LRRGWLAAPPGNPQPGGGVWNASYHRLQLLGGNRTAIRLDLGRYLRSPFEAARGRAAAAGRDRHRRRSLASLHGRDDGRQMPEEKDELAAAGALAGAPLEVLERITKPVLAPAHAEYVLEGVISPDEEVQEGPFGEFVGYYSNAGPAPVVEITALTRRAHPVYFAINGAGRETVMLRKYVLEACALKTLRQAVPIVTDVDMTAARLHRFHLNIAVRKTRPRAAATERGARGLRRAQGPGAGRARGRRHRHPQRAGCRVRDRHPL
jgi:2,5-furandicarboxylate decarboxylase 1